MEHDEVSRFVATIRPSLDGVSAGRNSLHDPYLSEQRRHERAVKRVATPAYRHGDGPVVSRGTSLASGFKRLADADVDRPLFTRPINDHSSSNASSIARRIDA